MARCAPYRELLGGDDEEIDHAPLTPIVTEDRGGGRRRHPGAVARPSRRGRSTGR